MISKVTKYGLALGLSATLATGVYAQEPNTSESANPEAAIKASLEKLTSGAQLGEIRPSVIDGLYNVQIIGGPAVIISADGKHVIMGEVFDVTDSGLAPVQDPYLLNSRREFVASLGEKESIKFAPDGETKHVAYVFTDVDCGYCRRLHSQMHSYNEMGVNKPGYNDLGIEIRYLAYPRAGANSPSAAKLESAWCADDQPAALDKLKNLETVSAATCEASPVEKQYLKGGEMGVTGTPAILLPDGRLFVGYQPPEQLLQTIKSK
ncbi:thioredoxin fold domain-containing protein [Gilvimarinus polysaccharolyticus]|uniref:thioredoxin fold domain-containing protein n=1 Tax=Gilvimarinus polysaccharolyticus TaxID=863921 RepID=UPI000673ACDD|nr:thioredoxin fold domain-containing protein [Gilvimarinus polysaccharolyticus]